MGLFGRRNADEQIAVLRAELRAMHEQLDTGDRSRTELASELDRLAGQVARRPDEREGTLEATMPTPLAPPPAPPTLAPPTAPIPPVDPARLERIEERLGELAASTERLDDRVTNVSTELANQLTELSTDLDYVAQGLPPGTTVSPDDPELVEARLRKQLDEEIDARLGIELGDVRDNAERLALEQARYEIRFRQDLADLADKLRRPRQD